MQEDRNDQYMEFIDLAVHDLDAPLRKLNVFVSRLKDKYSSALSDDAILYTQRIAGCVTEMRSLIDGLTILGKLNGEELKFVSCDTRMIAEEAIRELQPMIRETKAMVTTQDMPVLCGHVTQYSLLFRLLIENAIKFSQKDKAPVIAITAEPLSSTDKEKEGVDTDLDYFRISVADNGRGIRADDHEKIFRPLVRLHGKSDYPGNGLGLSMCKKIAANHRGRIYAEENLEGGGSRFVLIMPANPDLHVKR